MAFPPWENSDHVTASVSIDFHSNSKWMLLSMAQLIILMLIGKIFVMIWEILHGRIHLNSVFLVLLLLLNFASRCRLELMLYSSSKIFGQPLCCLYCLRCLSCCYCSYKFPLLRQASNPCKTILQAVKLAYANKIWVYHFPQNTLSWLLENR